jgi:hypothetical protein
MTQDEIVKMAREAGLVRTGDKWVEPARWGATELVHFAVLVAAAEREACAKVADEQAQDEPYGHAKFRCGNIATAIRARGEK